MQRLVVTCVCGERIQVPRSAIGRTGLCPACERPITIRSQNATSARLQPAPRAVEVSASVPVPASHAMPGPLAANRVLLAADDSKRRFSQAVDLYFNGRYAESLTLFDALIQEFPDLEEIQTGRALCLGALRKAPTLALEHQPDDGRGQGTIRPVSGRPAQQVAQQVAPQAPPIPMPPPQAYAGYAPAQRYEVQPPPQPQYMPQQAPPVYVAPPHMQPPPMQPYVVHPQMTPQAYAAPPSYAQPAPPPPQAPPVSQQAYVTPQPIYGAPQQPQYVPPQPTYVTPPQAYAPPAASVPPAAPHVPQAFTAPVAPSAPEPPAAPVPPEAQVQASQPATPPIAPPDAQPVEPSPLPQPTQTASPPAEPAPVMPAPSMQEVPPPQPKLREKLPLPDTLDEETFKRVLLDKMINGESDDIQLRATELAAKVFGYLDNELNEELASMQRLLDSSEVTDYEFRLPEIRPKQATLAKPVKPVSPAKTGEKPVEPHSDVETHGEGTTTESAPDAMEVIVESDADVSVAVQSE